MSWLAFLLTARAVHLQVFITSEGSGLVKLIYRMNCF